MCYVASGDLVRVHIGHSMNTYRITSESAEAFLENIAAKLEAQRVLLRDMVGTWGLEPQTSTVSSEKREPDTKALPIVSNNLSRHQPTPNDGKR